MILEVSIRVESHITDATEERTVMSIFFLSGSLRHLSDFFGRFQVRPNSDGVFC